jgi:hypothetical protein
MVGIAAMLQCCGSPCSQPRTARISNPASSQSVFARRVRVTPGYWSSFRSWLAAGLFPGLTRQPLKKLGLDAEALLTLLRRWQGEATKAGNAVNRIVVAFEAGRDGFWLARWLRARGIEAYVIHGVRTAPPRRVIGENPDVPRSNTRRSFDSSLSSLSRDA